MGLRERFEKETGLSFDCDLCHIDEICCPEENDCPVQRKYTAWLENLTKLMLEELIRLYEWQITTNLDISLVWVSAIRKLIEQITQKKIEEVVK